MRLLLLGRDGQLGSELHRALAPLGSLTAYGRAEADLEDPDQLADAVADAEADVIVNAAAFTAVDEAERDPDRAHRVNGTAVGEIAALAARTGARLIHYSTDYVFDGRKRGPYTEPDETAPQNTYGRSKRAGEAAIAESGADAIVLRTSWLHAAHGHNFIRTMLRLATERDSLRVVTDQIGAPTSAEFVADVTAEAIRSRLPPGLYHLTATGKTSWNGLARFAIEEAHAAGMRLRARGDAIMGVTSADYPTAAARPANSLLDTTKIRTALGIALPDWRVGVRRTVAQLVQGVPA